MKKYSAKQVYRGLRIHCKETATATLLFAAWRDMPDNIKNNLRFTIYRDRTHARTAIDDLPCGGEDDFYRVDDDGTIMHHKNMWELLTKPERKEIARHLSRSGKVGEYADRKIITAMLSTASQP